MNINQQLILHEGLRQDLYQCPAGKWTIGVGRNVEDEGISESEALYLLDNDITRITKECQTFEWFDRVSEIRTRVIIDMVFNLGMTRFRGFKKMIACLDEEDYLGASKQMLDSKWAREDVGIRAVRLAAWMKHDEEVEV